MTRIELSCARPIHHGLEFSALYSRLEAVREQAPGAEIELRLRSALADQAAFRELPADRIVFADGEKREELEILGGGEWGFRLLRPESAAARAAGERFQQLLTAASPRWSAPQPSLEDWPRNVLVHQCRSHLGDALWLTPLLRELHRRGSTVTVVAAPGAIAKVLQGNTAAELIPGEDPAPLQGRRFDAALFAFARRDRSRRLAEWAAESSVPVRVNLEYFETAGDRPVPEPWFTHEARCFWGSLPSPRMLLHALDPWLGTEAVSGLERRVEFRVLPEWREEAERKLGELGIGNQPFAVLTPGGESSERWPPRLFAALAEELGLHVLIEGGPDDEAVLREVEAQLPARPSRTLAVRRDSFGVMAALCERCRLLVSNDSAPIHLAEAIGTPTVYFAHREKLIHSHPDNSRCRAIWDELENRVSRIPLAPALRACRETLARD